MRGMPFKMIRIVSGIRFVNQRIHLKTNSFTLFYFPEFNTERITQISLFQRNYSEQKKAQQFFSLYKGYLEYSMPYSCEWHAHW